MSMVGPRKFGNVTLVSDDNGVICDIWIWVHTRVWVKGWVRKFNIGSL